MLNKNAFKVILSLYPELNIDLLASRLNNQLALYCSWKPDPGCAFVDALAIDWRKFNFQPWIMKPSKSLPQHASQQTHPLHNKLHLMVRLLSGNPLHSAMFLQTLPRSSWPPGEWAHKNDTKYTWKNGWHFVIKEALLTVHQR